MFSRTFSKKSDITSQELGHLVGLSYDTYAGRRVSPRLAMQLTAVFSCVRVLAESVGMLPCALYERTTQCNQRATKERLHQLLSAKPNGYMTSQEFWELLITSLCLRAILCL
ncbi:phage portal protein [Arsenophonus nasoniae]|uniref:Phage portal protein n=1 Tax=Arsenophonus nasoniae TaxID=638 RepID=A0A4P7L5L8_9GAMM|nr:Phage portal protein [Arsenophonus nasoniae]